MAKKPSTNGPDTFHGTVGMDVFDGKGGDDVIYGGDGNDILHGGNGKDYLDDDLDYLSTGDVIYPLIGGDDKLYGDANDDVIYIFTGNDTADGGSGNDSIFNDSPGLSVLIGGTGNDYIWSGTGSATIIPGPGDDIIEVDYYKQGADTFAFESNIGGFGKDTLSGFNQNYPTIPGDRIEFIGYKSTDFTAPPAPVGNDTVFTFKDGSSLTLTNVSDPLLNVDYFFV